MKRAAGLSLPILVLAACEPALAPVALRNDAQGCFIELPITEQLVEESSPDQMTTFAATTPNPAFLIGHLSYLRAYNREPPAADDSYEPHGGVLYVKSEGGWRAILPSEGEAAVGVYVSPGSPDVYVLSQLQVEGPGQSFTLTRSTDGLASAACQVIDFPADLNQPGWAMEYLTPTGFQIDRRASGTLTASAELDQETDKSFTAWYQYTTTDGGATWSAPVRTDTQPAPLKGPLVEATAPAPADLIADLKAFAKGK
jgi:hypothetical protein